MNLGIFKKFSARFRHFKFFLEKNKNLMYENKK